LQPAAQLAMVCPHTTIESPQGIVEQSGNVQFVQAPIAQLCPEGHIPHCTMPPQPSETDPQIFVPHAWPFDIGMQHFPLSHSSPIGHIPHWILPPQPSDTAPQVTPMQACAGVIGAQHMFCLQPSAVGHVLGHFTVPPQPSGTCPHATPMQAFAADIGVQHVPLLHSLPALHVPQVTGKPHASSTVPQVAPFCWQSPMSCVSGWQVPLLQT
jgi:hypothetical protein